MFEIYKLKWLTACSTRLGLFMFFPRYGLKSSLIVSRQAKFETSRGEWGKTVMRGKMVTHLN